jgi:HTH-type transcriptional regulator, sugar sensing transcriptional regulator
VIDEKAENTLVNMGFTSLQARVYLVLSRNGPSKVTAIAKLSHIHRTHLYEVLKSLEERGFAEKQLVSGTYTAISLQEITQTLVKDRRREIAKLESELEDIAKTLPEPNTESLKRKLELVVTPNKTSNFAKGYKYIESAKQQIDIIHTWKRFTQYWVMFEDHMAQTMSRGVIIRQIVEMPPDLCQAKKYLSKEIFRHPLFELRIVTKTGGNLTIIDDSAVFLSTTKDKEDLGETPLVFSNYEGLLGLMRNYFDYCWRYGYQLNDGKLTPYEQPITSIDTVLASIKQN